MNFAPRLSRLFPGILLVVVATGCPKSSTPSTKTGAGDAREDALAAAVNRLERNDDPATCREVLAAIDASPSPRDPKPEPTQTQVQALATLLKLSPDEARFLASPVFAAVDAEHLVDCFLLRDAAQSLDLQSYPEAERAALAFRWVCRQIYIDKDPSLPAPAWWVLQAGSGTALDRAYVFLQLLQQCGMDGCLIGPPEMAGIPSVGVRQSGDQLAFAPVRAVGARVGNEILLFDPWTGTRIMAGDKPATLAQVREKPESVEEWLASRKINADEARRWQIYLAAPLVAIEPRMAWFERQVPAANAVKLAIDPAALQARFRTALNDTIPVQFWAVPQDPFSLLRLLLTFNYENRGERGDVVRPMVQQFRSEHFPSRFIPVPKVGGQPLTGEPYNLIVGLFQNEFNNLYLAVDSPRDRLLRGNFSNAVSALADLKERNDQTRDRVNREQVTQADINKWSEEANRFFAESIRAEEKGDQGAAFKAKVERTQFLRTPLSEKMAALVKRQTSTLLSAESAYQLALIMHERAARAAARHDRQPSPASRDECERLWKNADESWGRFLNYHDDNADLRREYSDRDAHARRLRDECREQLKTPAK